MRCPECGAKVADNDIFCGNCNAELIAGGEAAVSQTVQEEPEKKSKKKPVRKKRSEEDSPKRTKAVLKIAAAVIVIVILIIVIVLVAPLFKTSKGKKIFDKVPLGRNIAMIEAETEENFLVGENSPYGALNYIADYDYICESEKSVDVDGIKLPEWAVVLNEDSSGNVDEATFYNFSILKYSWMGEKMSSKVDASTVEYGMRIKTAERALGMKPYTIVKENAENTSTYAYRYHYTDEESGNNCVMNFYVVVDDSNNQVKYVYDEQLDYLNLILRGTTKSEER